MFARTEDTALSLLPTRALGAALALAVGLWCPAAARAQAASEVPEPLRIEEAREVLDRMARAFEEEDLEGLMALLSRRAPGVDVFQRRMEDLFRRANYFEVAFEDLRLSPTPDGALAGRVLQTIRYEEVGADHSSVLRRQIGLRLVRRPTGRIELTALENLPPLELPVPAAVRARHYDLQVDLFPAQGRATVRAEIRLRNTSPEPVDAFAFLLDGFAEDLSVRRLDGTSVLGPLRRAAFQVGEVRLSRPIEGGEEISLRFDYEIRRTHVEEGARLVEDGVVLADGLPWIPVFHQPAEPQEPAFRFDLRVTVPAAWAAVTAGDLVRSEPMASDRAAFFWYSPAPTAEVPLVAGPLVRIPLAQAAPDADAGPMEIQVWVPRGVDLGVQARTLLGRVAWTYRFMAETLGPPAHPRVHVVYAPYTGVFGASFLWILDDRYLDTLPVWRPEPSRVFAHQAAHAWFLQGLDSLGPGAALLREGLTEHMAHRFLLEAWGEETYYKFLRHALSSYMMLLQPGVPIGLDERTEFAFLELARTKTPLLLHELGRLVGQVSVRDGLRRFFQEHAGGAATIWDLQGGLSAAVADTDGDPDTVVDWFSEYVFNNALPDPLVVEVASVPAEEGSRHTIQVRNEGRGRIRLPVRVETTEASREIDLLLADRGEAVLQVTLPGDLRRVVLDPTGAAFQKRRDNDWWPGPPTGPDRGLGEQRVPRERILETLRNVKQPR